MPLAIGARLGPYEIVAPLGAGGMGEVYRARDTQLKREVAIKVLPEPFAQDADRLSRFQREAELLATLNHPNIAAVYGLEKSDGVTGIVLELVEGDTLAERIEGLRAEGKGLPLDEALAIARQIAEAFEAAHEKGVIHRDLKPANVKVTADGKVKVLDFGLAKMLEQDAAKSSLTMSPTMSVHATYAGVILGTAAYMSPEQARGRPVDKRTDIWAFGCVLFEMLTGTRPFDGEDVAEMIGAVIHKEPAWTLLPAATPAVVRTVLQRCLEKDPKQRIRDIGDVQLALAGAFESPQVSTAAPAMAPSTRRGRVAIAAAALVAAAGLATLATWAVARPAPVHPQPVRFAIVPPPTEQIGPTNSDRQLAISPDGTHLAYVAVQGQLVIRAIDQLDVQPLRGVTDVRNPFWSPDGKWIGFFGGRNEIRKVSVTGGPPIVLCRTTGAPRGASWGSSDTIVFATNDTSIGLMSVPSGGGTPTTLTKPDTGHGEVDHVFPSVLPGGRAVLFTISTAQGTTDNAQVGVLDLKTGQRKTLVRGGSHAEYVAPSTGSGQPGFLVYAVAGTLRAVGFDVDRLEVLGDPVPVVEQVMMVNSGAAEFSVSKTGALVYQPGSAAGTTGTLRSLVWVSRSGREEPIKAPQRAYTVPRLSPDGTRLAVSINDQESDIWVWDFAHETLGRLTFGPTVESQPAWTPDGRRIIFSSGRSGPANLFWQLADGTGSAERLTTSPNAEFNTSISPDGKQVVLLEQAPVTGNDLMLFHIGGKPQPTPLLHESFSESRPEISPDGRWLAYTSNETGQDNVYVRPFPNVNGGRWQVSPAGGTRPAWARSGKELFYGTADGAIVSVPVQTNTTFSSGIPTKLFDWRTLGVPNLARTYDVSADGQKFLMIKESAGSTESPGSTNSSIVVVLNWTEELKTRLQAK